MMSLNHVEPMQHNSALKASCSMYIQLVRVFVKKTLTTVSNPYIINSIFKSAELFMMSVIVGYVMAFYAEDYDSLSLFLLLCMNSKGN